jgi:hypothetical protein
MRARNAKAWAVVRRLAKLRSVSSSASLKVKTDESRKTPRAQYRNYRC